MKIAKGIIFLALYNQLLHPIAYTIIPPAMKLLFRIPIAIELTTKKYSSLPREYTTLDYLNLASSVVNNNGLEGNCKHYANATYETYHKLIKQNNRNDLKDEVNFIFGKMINAHAGHVMLEYTNENGIRTQYETTLNTPKLEPKKVQKYSKSSLEEKTEESIVVFSRTVPNSRISCPTLELLTYPGGAIGFLINEY